MFNPAGLAILFTAALSVAAMPSHFARHSHNHREIAARVPQPEVLPVVEVAARDMTVPGRRMLRRRGQNGRCNPASPASSSPLPSSTPVQDQVPQPSPTPSQDQDSQPSSDPTPSPTTPLVKGDINLHNSSPSQDPQQSTPTPDNGTPTPIPASTPTDSPTPSPSPTTDSGNTSNNNNNSGGSSGGGQTYTGQGTFYSTGLGACGITNNDSQYIAAVSHSLFDSFPGYDGVNPNHNPLCGKSAVVTYQGKTVTVQLTDRCEGCAYGDLDFSPAAFNTLSNPSAGRIDNIVWSIQ